MSKPKVRIIIRPDLTKWDLHKIIAEYVPRGWEEIFAKTTDERQNIADVVINKSQAKVLFPAKENIYKAFDLTPFHKVKVVIIGQDPYYTYAANGKDPRAVGLSFSVACSDSIPVSLNNIFREIRREYPDFVMPKCGDLTKWAKQGVLLLNMALTVPLDQANEHKSIWAPFTRLTVQAMTAANPNIIFVLWGKEANDNKMLKSILSRHILSASHPASRDGSFYGNDHFKKINEILVEQDQEPIDWQL